jgi:hypothetical protein
MLPGEWLGRCDAFSLTGRLLVRLEDITQETGTRDTTLQRRPQVKEPKAKALMICNTFFSK